METADELVKMGYDPEVVDPRTIRPLDIDTIAESIKKTNRCVIIDECNPFASISAEMTYQIQSRVFDYLDAPIIRITARDTPAPYAKNLMADYMPQVSDAVQACKQVMYV